MREVEQMVHRAHNSQCKNKIPDYVTKKSGYRLFCLIWHFLSIFDLKIWIFPLLVRKSKQPGLTYDAEEDDECGGRDERPSTSDAKKPDGIAVLQKMFAERKRKVCISDVQNNYVYSQKFTA